MLLNRPHQQHPQGHSSTPTKAAASFVQFLPQIDQVIDAAGITSIVASLLLILWTIFRYVRARVNQGPWQAPINLPAGGVSFKPHMAGSAKSPLPNVAANRASQARNLVYSDSEDESD